MGIPSTSCRLHPACFNPTPICQLYVCVTYAWTYKLVAPPHVSALVHFRSLVIYNFDLRPVPQRQCILAHTLCAILTFCSDIQLRRHYSRFWVMIGLTHHLHCRLSVSKRVHQHSLDYTFTVILTSCSSRQMSARVSIRATHVLNANCPVDHEAISITSHRHGISHTVQRVAKSLTPCPKFGFSLQASDAWIWPSAFSFCRAAMLNAVPSACLCSRMHLDSVSFASVLNLPTFHIHPDQRKKLAFHLSQAYYHLNFRDLGTGAWENACTRTPRCLF